MKKLLFLILTALMIAGCGGSDEKIGQVEKEYMPSNVLLAKDSIHCFYVETIGKNNFLVKSKRNNYEVVWQKNIIEPSPITVDLGYGESKEYRFDRYSVGIDTDDLFFIILWGGYEPNARRYTSIGIYTNDGNFVSNAMLGSKDTPYIQYVGVTRWNDGSVIFSYKISTRDCYIIIDKTGKVIENKEGVELNPVKDPEYCWNEGYIFYSDNTLYICNLDSGTKGISISDIVNDIYPEEVNKPKSQIKNISCNDDIVTVATEVTLYSGTKENINIKVNYKTLDII